MQIRITKRAVDAIQPDPDKVIWAWDTELKGFGVKTSAGGHKAYVVEYRVGSRGRTSRKRRYTIGQHGSPWTPDLARSEAKRLLGLAAAGQDPLAARLEQRQKQAETLADLFNLYLERYARPNLKPRTLEETERALRRDLLPRLGTRHIGDITKRDIVRIIDDVASRAPTMANRLFAYMRRFFNWCVERGYIAISPCYGLKSPSEQRERDRVLNDAELVEVWRSAEIIGSYWAPVVKLMILTAQRRSEIVGMAWNELDLAGALWTIPGERTKNGRQHTVPLPPLSIELLKALPRIAFTDVSGRRRQSPLIFTTTGTTPVSGLSKLKRQIDTLILERRRLIDPEAEPMPSWTFHDLRRTATTGMARLGIEPHIADAILNHKDGTIRGVAAIYNRHAYLEERRAALAVWAGEVASLVAR